MGMMRRGVMRVCQGASTLLTARARHYSTVYDTGSTVYDTGSTVYDTGRVATVNCSGEQQYKRFFIA